MTEDKKLNYILGFGLCCNILCNVIYDIWQIPNVWYIGNSFAFVCYGYVLNKIINNSLTLILFALVVSQFVDEIFGDPTKLNAIEYLSFIVIVIYLKINKSVKVWTG